MLAGLVVASFTLTPERHSPTVAAPAVDEETAARVEAVPRGEFRWLRAIADVGPTPTPTPSEAPSLETIAVRLGESLEDPEATPEPTPEPTPEATPEPTRPPTPRPVASVAVAVNLPTAGWAELRMLELINASRARAGLVALAMDAGVANVARAHSSAEARVRYVYHDGPDGTASSRDVPACGTGWYGENTGKIWNDNVDALHLEFMAEPWVPINHRTNIMDPAFRRVGIGAVMGPDAMYMTMVFCR
jgi:uncharacterized protein YkwD